MTVWEIAGEALVLLGLVVLTIGVLGMLRMPDVYGQAHAASKGGVVGLVLLLLLAILIAAALLRLNRVAAVAASQLCMPPVVPALCIEAGYFMRHGSFLTLKGVKHLSNASFLELGYMGLERLWEWLLGSLLVGPALALVLGLMTYIAARIIERAWHEH